MICLLKSICKLFADDTKLATRGDNNSRLILQEDINYLAEWSKEWLMEFNEKKCCVLNYGPNNEGFGYKLTTSNGKFTLGNTTCEKDLGVYFTGDLKNREHVARAVMKANKTLGMIKRCFKNRDKYLIKKLYTSMIRSHLEYAVQVWSPFYKKDISNIERA